MGKKKTGSVAKRRRYDFASKDDLIQFLVLLPVSLKSLLRLKSVCKTWFTVIENDLYTLSTPLHPLPIRLDLSSYLLRLINVHLNLIKLSRENSLIMVSPKSKSKSGAGWRWWSTNHFNEKDDDSEDRVFKLDNLGGSSKDQQLVLKLDSFGVPPCYTDSYFFKKIVGSCNGLVCLYDKDFNKVSPWNPATGKHRILPGPIETGVDRPHHLVAFGFDVETKDYKVVILTGFKPEFYRPLSPSKRLCRVQVYSLSTDSWRLVEGITCLPGDPFLYPSEVLHLNGSCFFMAHFFCTKHHQPCIPANDRFLISFDLTKEIITPIQLPDHHRDQTLYLTCLADKMALFTVVRTYDTEIYGYEDYDIWVLNEHGNNNSSSSVNKDSWTKLHSFQITVERPGEMNIPRGISNDGKFALLEFKDSSGLGKRMKLYHLVSKEVKRTFLSCGSVGSKAIAYKPSLVSIIDGK